MRVIGKTTERDGEYICYVSHTELEKFLDLYYGKMKRLEVGHTVDLGKGYDHASEIARSMDAVQKFVQANQTIVTAILNGLNYQRIVESAAVEAGAVDSKIVPRVVA